MYNIQEWIDIVEIKNKIMKAKGLIALHVWRKNLRGEATKGFLNFTEIEPFAYAYDKRRVLIETVKYVQHNRQHVIIKFYRKPKNLRSTSSIAGGLVPLIPLPKGFLRDGSLKFSLLNGGK